MFNFSFSIYGMFAWIVLVLISFILNYILRPNFKNRYRLMNTENSSAIKIAKNYCDYKNKKVFFKIQNNTFWEQEIFTPFIKVEKKDFYSNSPYSIQNVVFKSIIMCSYQNSFIIKKQIFLKIICFVSSLFLSLSLILGFWIGVIIFSSAFVLLLVIEFILTAKMIKFCLEQFNYFLDDKIQPKILRKFMFSNKFFFIKKYIDVFTLSLVEIFSIFKKWGKDG